MEKRLTIIEEYPESPDCVRPGYDQRCIELPHNSHKELSRNGLAISNRLTKIFLIVKLPKYLNPVVNFKNVKILNLLTTIRLINLIGLNINNFSHSGNLVLQKKCA